MIEHYTYPATVVWFMPIRGTSDRSVLIKVLSVYRTSVFITSVNMQRCDAVQYERNMQFHKNDRVTDAISAINASQICRINMKRAVQWIKLNSIYLNNTLYKTLHSASPGPHCTALYFRHAKRNILIFLFMLCNRNVQNCTSYQDEYSAHQLALRICSVIIFPQNDTALEIEVYENSGFI